MPGEQPAEVLPYVIVPPLVNVVVVRTRRLVQGFAVRNHRKKIEAADQLLIVNRDLGFPVLVEWIQQERDREIQLPEQSQGLEDPIAVTIVARDWRRRGKDENRPARQLIDHKMPLRECAANRLHRWRGTEQAHRQPASALQRAEDHRDR